MKKLLEKKFVTSLIIIIVLCMAYVGINKIIKKIRYENNDEIIFDQDKENESTSDLNNKDEEKEKGNESEKTYEEGLNVDDSESDDYEEPQVESSKKIYVYITGEVNVPGVLILKENSRIIDAINSAGGTTNKANISKVNLAYVLKDGMKVNIPSNEELKNNSNYEYITMNSGDGKSDESYDGDTSNSDNNISNSDGKKSTGKVNINTATQTELETLPGIGPSIALKIINYRKDNGKFSSIEDIKNVSGIGDAKFEALKKYITI